MSETGNLPPPIPGDYIEWSRDGRHSSFSQVLEYDGESQEIPIGFARNTLAEVSAEEATMWGNVLRKHILWCYCVECENRKFVNSNSNTWECLFCREY